MRSVPVFEITLPGDYNIQLSHIKTFIEQTNMQYRLPVLFELHQDKMIMYHPNHINDYCSLEIRLWREGNLYIIGGFLTGHSKQWKKKVYSESSKEYLRQSYWGSQFGLDNSSEFLLRSGFHGLKAFGYDEQKMNDEICYYHNVIGLVKRTFNVQ